MPLLNEIIKVVDRPSWEYCRFTPQVTTAVSSLTTGNTLTNRYLYYQISNLLYRYDTVCDSWQQLSSTPTNTPTIMNNNVLSNSTGHYGQAIGSGGGLNTIQLAGLSGKVLIGYKIRIIAGTGAGQERTITDVAEPVVHERGMCTSVSGVQVIDASTGVGLKQWKTNQWKNYQVRIDWGSGRTQLRPILYNTQNSAIFTDVNYLTVNSWANCPLVVPTVANNSFFVIESHIATVDTNWTIPPDDTSQFMILSGGIWNVSQGTTSAPFFSFMYYDVLSDVWYQKSTQTGLKTLVFLAGSDLSLERLTENGGVLFTETAFGGGNRYLISTAALTPMQYANFEVRIVSGTGIGQVRSILSNTATRINVVRDWEINPDATSVYQIWRDVGKIFLIGGGDAGMLQYSRETDQWSTGKQLDFGQCNQLSAKRAGEQPFALTGITRVATGISTVNPTPVAAGAGYNIDDLITLGTGTGGVVRVTGISTVGGVTSVVIESVGTGYAVATAAQASVLPAGGTGCTIAVTAVDFTEYATTVIAHNFRVGDTVTIQGASGTGAAKFNGTYVVKGIPTLTNNLTFSYCSVGDPGAASATVPYSPLVTQLVDCTKNWIPNEHIGKLVQLSTNAVLSIGQVRRIIGNTATTITWTLAATAPVNGTTKYIIEDIKPFGTERTSVGERCGTEGFATGGSTTTIVDSTKTWIPNYWSRTAQRKVRIVEGTGVGAELAITSNTATTLTFAAQAFTPDATTRYIIMDAFGTATAGATTTLTDASQNWEVNYWVGSRVRFLSGTSQGNEYIITANTATVLTFAAGTAPDVSTAYAILEASPKSTGLHLDNITNCSVAALNHKYLYAFTGTITTELSRYNINTEHWGFLSYFPQTETFTTGTMYCYDGEDRIYINASTAFAGAIPMRVLSYNIAKNILEPAGNFPYGHSTLVSGNRMEIIKTEDGLKYLYIMRSNGQEMWRTLLFW
jgi:hypothetical protein